jgi:hypothetical protein
MYGQIVAAPDRLEKRTVQHLRKEPAVLREQERPHEIRGEQDVARAAPLKRAGKGVRAVVQGGRGAPDAILRFGRNARVLVPIAVEHGRHGARRRPGKARHVLNRGPATRR